MAIFDCNTVRKERLVSRERAMTKFMLGTRDKIWFQEIQSLVQVDTSDKCSSGKIEISQLLLLPVETVCCRVEWKVISLLSQPCGRGSPSLNQHEKAV